MLLHSSLSLPYKSASPYSVESAISNRGAKGLEPKIGGPSRIRAITREILKERFSSSEELGICERNINGLTKLLEKRGFNFFQSFLTTTKKMSEGNPIVLMGLLKEKTIEEISDFSIRGLERWTEERPAGNADVMYRYVTLTGDFGEVDRYKAGSAAVELGEIKESLRTFSIGIFNTYLLIGASKESAVTSKDSVYIFLPQMMADFETREENEMAYYLLSGHETSHKAFGSFTVIFKELIKCLNKEGMEIEIKKEEEGTKIHISYKGNGYTFSKDDFHEIISLLPHAMLLHIVWNAIDDMRVDSKKYDEKTPAHRNAFQRFVRVMLEKRGKELEEALEQTTEQKEKKKLESQYFALIAITSFVSASLDKEVALRAIFPKFGDMFRRKIKYQGNDDERAILEICKALPRRDRRMIGKYRKQLLEIAHSKEDHSTQCWKLAFELYKNMLPKTEMEQEPGVPGGSPSGMGPDLNPFSQQSPQQLGMQDDVPDATQDPNLQPLSTPSPLELIEMILDELEGEKSEAQVEGIGGGIAPKRVEIIEPPPIHIERLEESQVEIDTALVDDVEDLISRIRQKRRVMRTGALRGRVNPRERNRWKGERRRGICKPRDYHYVDNNEDTRSVNILSIGDASGSTWGEANEIIVSVNNSMAHAIDEISGINYAFGFYYRDGSIEDGQQYERTTYYEGMSFEDSLRTVSVNPGGYNLDYEIIRFGGDMLLAEPAKVRILVLTLDSMTCGGDDYRDGIDMVRDELNNLRDDGIIPFAFTVRPSESFYTTAGFDHVDEYLEYIYGAEGYFLMEEIGQLKEGWLRFIETKQKLFRK